MIPMNNRLNTRLSNRHTRLVGLGQFNRQKFSGFKWFKWFGAAMLLVLILAVAIPAMSGYYEVTSTTTVVNSHERVCSSSGDSTECKYLVFTDAGTFELTDSLYLGRWNSSDMYGRIKDGQTYKIDHYGWRFGCASSYPNIKNMEPVG